MTSEALIGLIRLQNSGGFPTPSAQCDKVDGRQRSAVEAAVPAAIGSSQATRLPRQFLFMGVSKSQK